ncbi:Thioredoxin family protein [Tritrichomonas foetus]|uniref:protein disulfide-isomerase n=1 Tax=Tritrichomonas foetus TaxID=1144522 RepID=A0A1J4L3I6_9EUKA|nr:Thioredoxin family protein [Tritrichomonas foetus]|eukprot:OHT17640.1 Thioredoxin family protein [Tritrichomonas foetus]
MAAEFAEAATTFTDVTFGGVDCSVNKKVCEKHKIDGYPTIYLFKEGKTEGIEFHGQRSVDGFCDFIENYTTSKAKRPPKVFIELNPLNFENHTSSRKCLFVTFFAPWCGHCKRFLPEAKIAAAAFQVEEDAAIGTVNCELYKEFCDGVGVSGYPSIKLFKDNSSIEYDGPRTADGVASFINKNCGTERAANGLLLDTAGIVDEATPLVKEFLAGKADALERMKAIKGAEFYVKVMERINAKGVEQVQKDMETMNKILTARKGSYKALDGMKRRYNVFNEFIPKPEPEPVQQEAEPAQQEAEAAQQEAETAQKDNTKPFGEPVTIQSEAVFTENPAKEL